MPDDLSSVMAHNLLRMGRVAPASCALGERQGDALVRRGYAYFVGFGSADGGRLHYRLTPAGLSRARGIGEANEYA